jgi:hypothetical protein
MSYYAKRYASTFLLIVGILWAVIAVWQFYLFVVFRDAGGSLDVQGGGSHLWYAIGAAVLTCVCVCFAIFRRINQHEELHITS